MKPFYKAGFTIIETMLFLAVSGFLIMGILAGTGVSINTQRYRDSVVSLRSFLQQQYSDVSNVRNSSQTNPCLSSSGNRGQTDCVILGRYVTSQGVSNLSVKNVIGTIPKPPVPGEPVRPTDDIGMLPYYKIETLSNIDDNTYNLEWDATMDYVCLLYTSPSPRDRTRSRMPSSA